MKAQPSSGCIFTVNGPARWDRGIQGCLHLLLFFICLATTFIPTIAHGAERGKEPRIAVVVSSQIRPYILALDGLRSKLDYPVTVYYMTTNPEIVKRGLEQRNFDLIVAIGPNAARLVWEIHSPHTSKIALMVLDLKNFLRPLTPCGIDLRIPLVQELQAISARFKNNQRIGIPFSQPENRLLVDQAIGAADEFNIRVLPIPIENVHDVFLDLARMYNQIDILLCIPDRIFISEAIVTHLIKECLLHGVAVVGYNHFFIESGALMAFTIDYKLVGTKGAELIRQIMAGKSCRVYTPPFKLEWNERVWNTLKRIRSEAITTHPGPSDKLSGNGLE